MRKSHGEHFSTAVPQKADVVLNAANGSFVPLGDIRVRAGRDIWISYEPYHVTRRPTLPFRAMCDSPLTDVR